jgi:hypothetical protein
VGIRPGGNRRLWAALLFSAVVRSLELRLARARVAPGAGDGQRGRGRHNELNGGEEAMNPRAERGERR